MTITGTVKRETYENNQLIDHKNIYNCILNPNVWQDLARQEKEIGITNTIKETYCSKNNQYIITSCTKEIGDTKVVYTYTGDNTPAIIQ